jgi:hypothetical protein
MSFTPEIHKSHAVILRDGLPVAVIGSGDYDTLQWFHRNTSQSMDWAMKYDGYTIESRAAMVRGWMSFHTMATRHGYGVAGSLARLAVEIQTLVSVYESNADAAPGQWRDYVAEPHLVAMLAAFVGLLDTTGSTGAFDIIKGELSQWAENTGHRIGHTGDLADA